MADTTFTNGTTLTDAAWFNDINDFYYNHSAIHTIWVPAIAMVSRTTNGAATGSTETATNKIMIKTLDFDAATDEFAQFAVRMPKSWDEGTLTAVFYWSVASGANDVIFAIQGVAVSNDDVLDAAFGTAVTATDTVIATTDLHVSPTTAAMTIAGTPAAGDLVTFQVYRDADAGGDTLATDARLHGVVLFYTVNNWTDV